MNKGCFLKSVAVLTILIAVFVYLVNNKTINFYNLLSGKINEELQEKFDSSYVKIKNRQEADSLKRMFYTRVESIKTFEDIEKVGFDEFITYTKMAAKDSLIDSIEFNNLKKILK